MAFAYWGIRKQLKHDRELAQAARRIEAAREFATVALTMIDMLEDHSTADPWWLRPRCDELMDVYSAQLKSQILLGQSRLIDDITSGIRDISHAWEGCHKRIQDVANQPGVQATPARMGSALSSGIFELFDPVVIASEELIRWDGHLPEPKFDWPNHHIPLRGRRADQKERWLSYYANQSEAMLRVTPRKKPHRSPKQSP
ncbi:hypothetical protein [Kribbella voronezhensis]|uniref:hypothetical protein n=1 Tax=Kribbella voronezhensis TaxID=2512212 RepID=UPI001063FB7F|nr:hypothetical protein [Kribbella voronezhensis]